MKILYQLTAALRAINFHKLFIYSKTRLGFLSLILLTSLFSVAQTTYNFSTAATLSNQGGFYNTQALVTINGVSYKLTHLGNGNFTNQTTGGNGNSPCLKKDGSGGDFLKIERADGAAFQFYGLWLNSSSMYSPPFYQPPYYNIKYYDQNNAEIVSETYVSSVQNETITITKNLKVNYVYVTYNAILYFNMDDLIVGPAAASAPSVSTTSINQFSASSAVLGGNVTNDGGAVVTERGIVYNTTGAPTIADNKAQIGSATGIFSQSITGLNSNTLYYVRSYALNAAGISYGTQVTVTTAADFVLPQIHYFNTAWLSTTSQASPFTKYVEGWNITATTTGTGLVSVSRITGISGTSAAAEGVASARTISSTAAEDLVSMSIKANDNSLFSLQSFKFKYLTKVANTSFGTITVTGYLNGVAVPGAVASLNGIAQATAAVYTYSTFDLTGNNKFNNIDQFIITASNPLSAARLSAIDIDVLNIAPPVIVPLILANFNGQLVNDHTALNWNTKQEQNTSDFEIEYSADGIQYQKIGTVAAAGNSQVNRDYAFIHANPAKGNNYYRLKMNDIDGKFSHSAVINIKLADKKDGFTVYPNPATGDHCFINVASATILPLTYRMVDVDGKSVQSGVIKTANQKINLNGLSKGNYFIILSNGLSQKIIL